MFLPLLTAAALCGQIPDHSIGVGASAFMHVGYSAPATGVTLDGTYHLFRGVDLYLRVPLYSVPRQARVPNAPVLGVDWASGGSGGVRYLFLDGPLRPWAGAHLSNLNVFMRATLGRTVVRHFLGAGLSTGIDVALPGFTLGLRGTYDALLMDVGRFNRFSEHVGVGLTAAFGF